MALLADDTTPRWQVRDAAYYASLRDKLNAPIQAIPSGTGSLSPEGRPALPPWVQAKLDEQKRRDAEADALRRLSPVNQSPITPTPPAKRPKIAPSLPKPSRTPRFMAPAAPSPAVDRAFQRGTPEYNARINEVLQSRTQGVAPGYGSPSAPGKAAKRTEPKQPTLTEMLGPNGGGFGSAVPVSSPPPNTTQEPPRQPRPSGPPSLSPETEEALFASVLAQDDRAARSNEPSAYAELLKNEQLWDQALAQDEAAFEEGDSIYGQFLRDERLVEEALQLDEQTTSPTAGPVRLDLLDQLPAMFDQTSTVYEPGRRTWAGFAGDGRRGISPEERFTAIAENLGFSGAQIADLLDGVPADEVGQPVGGFNDVGRVDRPGANAALRGEEFDPIRVQPLVINERTKQALLGVMTDSSPSDSLDQGLAGARGDETFSGEDLGFIREDSITGRHLSDSQRRSLGYLGEKVFTPSTVGKGVLRGALGPIGVLRTIGTGVGADVLKWMGNADPPPIPLPEFQAIPDAPKNIDPLFASGGPLDPDSAEGQWLYSAFIGDGVGGQRSDDRLATVLYNLGFRGESLAQLMEGTPGSEIGLPTGDHELGPGHLDIRDAHRLVSPPGMELDAMQIAAIMTSPDVRARAMREFGPRMQAR